MASFFATLKTELCSIGVTGRAEARRHIFAYADTFYNQQRTHSSLG